MSPIDADMSSVDWRDSQIAELLAEHQFLAHELSLATGPAERLSILEGLHELRVRLYAAKAAHLNAIRAKRKRVPDDGKSDSQPQS